MEFVLLKLTTLAGPSSSMILRAFTGSLGDQQGVPSSMYNMLLKKVSDLSFDLFQYRMEG